MQLGFADVQCLPDFPLAKAVGFVMVFASSFYIIL
jgi:hypothetical protein